MMFATATAMWLFWGGFVFLCVFNFLPAAIAYVNHHPDKHLLAMLNVVSLFSFALWIALMAWATAGRSDHPMIQRFIGTPQKRTRLALSVTALVIASFAGTVWTMARA
jgi:uncharacterized membrane protein